MEKIFEEMKPLITFTYDKNPSMHIQNSYMVSSNDEIMYVLNRVHDMDEYKQLQAAGYTRTIKSEFKEWKAHNLLYKLGILKERTSTTDFAQNESKLFRFGYAILSMF